MKQAKVVMSVTISLTNTMLAITIALTQAGCNSKDDRFAVLAEQAVAEQARQNQQLAQQSSQLTETAHQLVKQDALSRREMIDRHADLQESIQRQQMNLDQQRDSLDRDRKEVDKKRQRDPIVAQSISSFGLLAACLIPLALAAYVLYTANRSDANEKQFNEILFDELTNQSARFLPEFRTMILPTNSVESIPNLEDRRQDDESPANGTDGKNENQDREKDENNFVF